MTGSRLNGFAAGLRSWCRRIYPALSSPPTQPSDRPPAIWGVVIAVFALCIFASAFLLFLVEPMVAKMVLPVVGGTPAVWTTSVLFFQTVLLVGYGYSHWLAIRLQWRWQAVLHGVVLLLPITVLPIHLIPGWNPPTTGSPVGYLVVLLSAMVGLPFFVVSTTSPLVQHWFSRTGHPHSADPYFLYRASNLGSALGLLSYPALIEPHLGLRGQAQAWVGGYVAFLLLVAICLGLVAWTRSRAGETAALRPIAGASDGGSVDDQPITWTRRLRWVLLAAVPSTWMLAVTSYFTTAIRPLPLLWVIPLALYLFSFAIVFARRPLIPRRLLNRIFPFYALPVLGLILLGGGGPFWALALLHFGAFFLAALLCHGELAADRPNARYLTEFYCRAHQERRSAIAPLRHCAARGPRRISLARRRGAVGLRRSSDARPHGCDQRRDRSGPGPRADRLRDSRRGLGRFLVAPGALRPGHDLDAAAEPPSHRLAARDLPAA